MKVQWQTPLENSDMSFKYTAEQHAIIELIDERLIALGLMPRNVVPAAVQAPLPTYNYFRPEWHHKANPKRIILHWTGGTYVASSLDKEHYHFLIEWEDNAAKVVKGKYNIRDNDDSNDGDYARHVRAWNTNSIGVAICAAHGATPGRNFGEYPVRFEQWQLAKNLFAELCLYYSIDIKDCMSHFEVGGRGGPIQTGKWDISEIPSFYETGTELMDIFRQAVAHRKQVMQGHDLT